MATITRHPWRAELMDGTVVNEHGSVKGSDLSTLPVLRFSFLTPAGEVGVNHWTGLFFVLGRTLRHKSYLPNLRDDYRHWHRIGCFADFGGSGKTGVESYSLGMERNVGSAREFLYVKFPHDLKNADDVQAWLRISNGGRGGDSMTKVALTGGA